MQDPDKKGAGAPENDTSSGVALKDRPSGTPTTFRKNKKGFHTRSSFELALDQLICRLVVLGWKGGIALRKKKHQANLWLMELPYVAAFGEAMYMMGFWTEYTFVRMGRGSVVAARAIGRAAKRLYGRRVRPVLQVFFGFFNDMFQPVIQCVVGLRKLIRAYKEELVQPDGTVVRLSRPLVLRGIRNYLPVLGRGISCFFPIIALCAFFYTVNSVLHYDYVLAVQIDGQIVGYVESEQVFDQAKEDVQERVDQARESMSSIDASAVDTDQTWEINPTFTLRVHESETLSERAMADAILRASSDQIQEASALYVDGTLRAVTSEGDRLREYLDEVKAPYEDENNPNLRVEFVRSIELVDGVYFTESISDYDSIIRTISGQEQEQQVYTVQAGDTPWMIAANSGLTLNELYALNPEMTEPGYNMYVGDGLIISQEVDFLSVKQVITTTWQETIAHETTTTESSDYDWGVTRTLVEGSDGLKEVTADITYINGVETSREYISEQILVEPVTEEVVKGTYLRSGMVGSYGSGTFIWPVPNYTYVSRWMSSYHTGADICAAAGTPILASDGGVVVTSTYHYSYGNYVVIDHGNGYRTLYAHMIRPGISVGSSVSQGDIIGYVGSTGNSTGNHCHFEMYQNGSRFSARSVFPGM